MITDHLGNTYPNIQTMCNMYNISTPAYYNRIKRGWNIEKILTTPLSPVLPKEITDHLGNVYPSKNALCKAYDIKISTFNNRERQNWSIEKILTTPFEKKRRGNVKDHLGNKYNSIKEMCDKYNINLCLYYDRVKKGWNIEKILTATEKRQTSITTEDHLGNAYNSINDMCKAYNIDFNVFSYRIQRNWNLEKALTTPVKKTHIVITDHKGNKFDSISKMCEYYNISVNTYKSKLTKNISLEQILTEKTNKKPRQVIITDHKGNAFKTITDMCKYYNITREFFKTRRDADFTTIECLNLIPLINSTIKNTIVDDNMIILRCINARQGLTLDKLLFKCRYQDQEIIATRNAILTYYKNILS